MFIDSNNNEAKCGVYMTTCRQKFILALLQWVFISINLPTKRWLVKLRQPNRCEVDACKFIKTALDENVGRIQEQGGFHFLCLL